MNPSTPEKPGCVAVLLAVVALSACASNAFLSSWSAPDAKPLTLRGSKVVAVAMVESEPLRRDAEDAMVRELNARGAVGIPMYTLHPDARPETEAEARAALEGQNVDGAYVMRAARVDREVESDPIYLRPTFGRFWGGYYGYGWGAPWGATLAREVRTNVIVTVETLVYSLRQNKLVWGGQTRVTNPRDVDKVIRSVSRKVAAELERQGLLSAPGERAAASSS
jgi:hypothetical protein